VTEAPPTGAERARGEVEAVELSPAQQAFARRVAESKATAPHVYFERELGRPAAPGGLVAAAAAALRAVPLLNGAYRDGRAELYSRVNVAVGIEATGTLLFPVIRDADAKDGAEIERELSELAAQAQAGALASPALAGATFTVIDMSPAGAARYAPVINRGQAATLGAGTRSLTLACDARIAQGGEGAAFLQAVVERLESACG
jgi:pyruvate dehydrogenase E2 component (dihydrolipoamide acetyltransferase)